MVDGARAVWTLPNALTMVRIALVPIFALAFLQDGGTSPGWRLAATAVFVLAAVTDKLDGWLARRWGQITDLGKLLDPIADKLLMGTALCLLSWLGELPWWITAVVLVRELGITVMRFFLLRYVVLPASRGGKLKTALQSVAIGLFLLPLDHLPAVLGPVAWVVMAAAVAVTAVTGLDYVRVAVRIRRAGTTAP
ncbi:MAG: CDP-diacylglycerol--glycerol-3-phosphate 3-phosphatidyltransferase [Cellulomonas sp.]|nr:CDP-diacylglycerol--glycerol-3-phosphate 3-phosphatidyltransferase [Cellulomonas sp.]